MPFDGFQEPPDEPGFYFYFSAHQRRWSVVEVFPLPESVKDAQVPPGTLCAVALGQLGVYPVADMDTWGERVPMPDPIPVVVQPPAQMD